VRPFDGRRPLAVRAVEHRVAPDQVVDVAGLSSTSLVM
jgi:hypothetical protein